MSWNLLASLALSGIGGVEDVAWQPLGVELRSSAVDASARLYVKGLGFTPLATPVDSFGRESGVVLELDGFLLVLQPARPDAAPPPATGEVTGPYLNLVVGDLEAALDRALDAGANPCTVKGEPHAMVLGRAVRLADPGGHPFHLIELADRGISAEAGARLFNVGLRVAGFEELEPLFTRLGYDVVTRSYLPRTLPFFHPGAARSRSNLVLHRHADELPPGNSSLLFEVADLEAAARAWTELGLVALEAAAPTHPLGRSQAFALSGGTALRLVSRPDTQPPRR